VVTANFTPAGIARRNIFRAGMHDREMFAVLVKYTMWALPAVFEGIETNGHDCRLLWNGKCGQ